jgi:hypothetical protein
LGIAPEIYSQNNAKLHAHTRAMPELSTEKDRLTPNDFL